MILLPNSPSRGAIRGFWLIISASAGATAAVLLAVAGVAQWALSGMAVAAVLAVPGLVRPMRVRLAYRAWNRAARGYAAGASRIVAAVCFFTVVLAAGRGAGPVRFARAAPAGSMWVPRGTQPASAYASQDGRDAIDQDNDRWLSTVRTWAGGTGNRWAVALVPFLYALHALDTDAGRGQDDLPADVYTLY